MTTLRAAFRPLSAAKPLAIALAAGLTLLSVTVRFVRWRFLLRRADVRVPARADLSAYLASLAGRATPAYVGELVRAWLLRRRLCTRFGQAVKGPRARPRGSARPRPPVATGVTHPGHRAKTFVILHLRR